MLPFRDKLDKALQFEWRSGLSKLFGQAKSAIRNKEKSRLIATQLVNALLGLVTGKLIATYVIPEQLGSYNLQFGAFTFFYTLLIAPLLQYKKASYQKDLKEYGYRNYIRSFILYALVLSVVLFVFFLFYHNGDFFSLPLLLILLLMIPVSYFSNFISDQFNILGNIRLFSWQTVLNNIAGAVFITAMLFFTSAKGYLTLWGMQVVIGVFGVIFFGRHLVKYVPIKKEAFGIFLKKQLRFTLPLIILAFFAWVNNYFDRYIIEANLGLKEVGIYNVNFGLGSKFFAMISPIFLVLLTPHIFQDNTIGHKKSMIKKYLVTYFGLGICLVGFIFLFHQLIGKLLLSDQYAAGFYIIYWISLSSLILTATFLLETLFYAQHRTGSVLWGNIFAAIASIILNLLLIPAFGMPGALIASIAAASLRFIYCFVIYRRI